MQCAKLEFIKDTCDNAILSNNIFEDSSLKKKFKIIFLKNACILYEASQMWSTVLVALEKYKKTAIQGPLPLQSKPDTE